MPLTEPRQRYLIRKYRLKKAIGNTLALCRIFMESWIEHCSLLSTDTKIHYYRYNGEWYGYPYLDTTVTEEIVSTTGYYSTVKRRVGTRASRIRTAKATGVSRVGVAATRKL